MRAIFEARELERFFGTILKLTTRPAELLRVALSTRGYRDIIEHFEDERGPSGAWQKRKASTNRRYDQIRGALRTSGRRMTRRDARRKYGSVEQAYAGGQMVYAATVGGIPRSAFSSGNKTLQLTGMLRKSILPASLKNQTKVLDKDKVLVFSSIEYSGQHDEGDATRNLPRRSFMWLSDQAVEDMGEIVLGLIMGEK